MVYEKTGEMHMVQGREEEAFIGDKSGQTNDSRLRELAVESHLLEVIASTDVNRADPNPGPNGIAPWMGLELPLDDSSKAVIHCNCARIHATIDSSQVERVRASVSNANPIDAMTYVEEAGAMKLDHHDGTSRFVRYDTVIPFDPDTEVLRENDGSRRKCAFCPFR